MSRIQRIFLCIAILSTGSIGITIWSAGITIAQVRVAGVLIFQSHERVGPLADLLFHARVILKICVELWMFFEELRVVDQRWCLAKLAGNFAMAIEKLIESRQVPPRDVIGLDSRPVLLASLPVLHGSVLRGPGLCARRLRVHRIREIQQRHRRRTEN